MRRPLREDLLLSLWLLHISVLFEIHSYNVNLVQQFLEFQSLSSLFTSQPFLSLWVVVTDSLKSCHCQHHYHEFSTLSVCQCGRPKAGQ